MKIWRTPINDFMAAVTTKSESISTYIETGERKPIDIAKRDNDMSIREAKRGKP